MSLRMLLAAVKVRKGYFAFILTLYAATVAITVAQGVQTISSPTIGGLVLMSIDVTVATAVLSDLPRVVRMTLALESSKEQASRYRLQAQAASSMLRSARERAEALQSELMVFRRNGELLSPGERIAGLAQFDTRYAETLRDSEHIDRLNRATDAAWISYEAAAAQVSQINDSLITTRIYGWVMGYFSFAVSNGLTTAAILIAGPARSTYADQWRDQLAGDDESGFSTSTVRRLGDAGGFVLAALRMRVRDASRPIWRPVDWLLRVQSRVHATIALAVGTQAIYITKHDGLYQLVTSGWEWCGGCAVALQVCFRWLRRVRGIELTAPDPPDDRD